ncbi:MAG: FemAB family XrtA/PEP-CTERM system-associated protein [Streptosporangiales bacterium]
MSAAEPGLRGYPLLTSGRSADGTGRTAAGPLRVGSWADARAWDDFVLRAPDGTLAHRWEWLRIVSETYGHRVIPLASVRNGVLVGILPLVQMSSRLFGRHLVSMPYLDTGGLCTAGDRAAEGALASAAVELAAATASPLELRHLADRPVPLVPSLHKVTMVVDLSGGEDAVWQRIHGNRRSQVRKARRAGLTASVHGSEALADFYRILATNLRDLGSPVHRRAFFGRIMSAFGEDVRIILVRAGDQAIGAAMVFVQGDRAVMPWMGTLRPFLPRAPGQLLYWQSLCYGIARGCRVFDLGRSSPGSGTYESKREWGAEPVQLFWHRLPGEPSDDDVQRWQWGTGVWRRLPVPVANVIGAAVRGGIPQ